jgi:hypothetical protein
MAQSMTTVFADRSRSASNAAARRSARVNSFMGVLPFGAFASATQIGWALNVRDSTGPQCRWNLQKNGNSYILGIAESRFAIHILFGF